MSSHSTGADVAVPQCHHDWMPEYSGPRTRSEHLTRTAIPVHDTRRTGSLPRQVSAHEQWYVPAQAANNARLFVVPCMGTGEVGVS